MQDFEKLGAFYLGKACDVEADTLGDLVLYDARDLTTHAVIIGMTGSGKTGLGIGLLEEAAIDRIPVIAIDPKGDMGNLLLTFPELRGEDFLPWVDKQAASSQGQTPEAYARAQADLWKSGLARWGQDGERIRKFRDRAELAIYTPGSNAGIPVSVLNSFNAPPEALRNDADLYRQRVQATATGILALAGLEADPVTSREHILVANLLDHAWQNGRSLDLGGLIAAIQQPPMERVGVMNLDAFFPAKDRFGLAMRLNNLLAAPGFEAWMQGEPLDAHRLLYTEAGKPRVSVMSIAHLSDAERMFFVCMLLNEIIGWMRGQPGTGTLRAVLYMDEIFGYLPPTASPPSKTLFLTLLKQARAYGLGLVLSTQNPVDLDYKALSNAGTWFIGRLQTERDKMRVMEGLEGAASGGRFDKARMEQTLAGMGKRRFLLHNVHEDEPVVFHTRWAMSYLSGPLTRDQIRALTPGPTREAGAAAPEQPPAPPRTAAETVDAAPILPSTVKQYFLPARGADRNSLVYHPLVAGAADVAYSSARYKVDASRRLLMAAEVDDGPVPLEWEESQPLNADAESLQRRGVDGAAYAPCPKAAATAANYRKWERAFKRWIRNQRPLTLLRSPSFKVVSGIEESEGEFRARLQQLANEKRDLEVGKLRKRYGSKTTTLEERLRRAEQAVEREAEQAQQKKLDTAISFGTAILGAVFGRKKISYSSSSRMGSAVKSVGRMRKEAGDVERAMETVEALREQLASLAAELQAEVDKLDTAFDAQLEELDDIVVKAKSTDIQMHFVALVWAPHERDEAGRLTPAWA